MNIGLIIVALVGFFISGLALGYTLGWSDGNKAWRTW